MRPIRTALTTLVPKPVTTENPAPATKVAPRRPSPEAGRPASRNPAPRQMRRFQRAR